MRHTSTRRRSTSTVGMYRGASSAVMSRPPREVDEGHPACPTCGGGVALRNDGGPRSHAPGGWGASAGDVKCLAGEAR